jgi:hypothetical protein
MAFGHRPIMDPATHLWPGDYTRSNRPFWGTSTTRNEERGGTMKALDLALERLRELHDGSDEGADGQRVERTYGP